MDKVYLVKKGKKYYGPFKNRVLAERVKRDTLSDDIIPINESLEPGILRNIVLPLISINEYVPLSPESNNIVMTVFVLNEPLAAYRLMNFIKNLDGVYSVHESDTTRYPNAVAIYIEFQPTVASSKIINVINKISELVGRQTNELLVFIPEVDQGPEAFDKEKIKKYLSSYKERSAIEERISEWTKRSLIRRIV